MIIIKDNLQIALKKNNLKMKDLLNYLEKHFASRKTWEGYIYMKENIDSDRLMIICTYLNVSPKFLVGEIQQYRNLDIQELIDNSHISKIENSYQYLSKYFSNYYGFGSLYENDLYPDATKEKWDFISSLSDDESIIFFRYMHKEIDSLLSKFIELKEKNKKEWKKIEKEYSVIHWSKVEK